MKSFGSRLKKFVALAVAVCLVCASYPDYCLAKDALAPPSSVDLLESLEISAFSPEFSVEHSPSHNHTIPQNFKSPGLPASLALITAIEWLITQLPVCRLPGWVAEAFLVATIIFSLWTVSEVFFTIIHKVSSRVITRQDPKNILKENWEKLLEQKFYELDKLSLVSPSVRISKPGELKFYQRSRYLLNTIIVHPAFVRSKRELRHELSHWSRDPGETPKSFLGKIYYYTFGYIQREEFARLYEWNISGQYYWRKIIATGLCLVGLFNGFMLFAAWFNLHIDQYMPIDNFLSPNIQAFGFIAPVSCGIGLWALISSFEERKIEARLGRITSQSIQHITELGEASHEEGLLMTHHNRIEALFGKNGDAGFLRYIDSEIEKGKNGEIIIVGTSLMIGMLKDRGPRTSLEQRQRMKKQMFGRKMKKIIMRAQRAGCALKFILPYPSHNITGLREKYEKIKPGQVLHDLEKSIEQLINIGINKENIMFYKASPHMFMIILPNYMLVNPYTLVGSGYEQACYVYENIGKKSSTYARYRKANFGDIWDNENTINLKQFESEGDSLKKKAKQMLSGIHQIRKRAKLIKSLLPNGGSVGYGILKDALEEVIAQPRKFQRRNARKKITLRNLMNKNEKNLFNLTFKAYCFTTAVSNRLSTVHRSSSGRPIARSPIARSN